MKKSQVISGCLFLIIIFGQAQICAAETANPSSNLSFIGEAGTSFTYIPFDPRLGRPADILIESTSISTGMDIDNGGDMSHNIRLSYIDKSNFIGISYLSAIEKGPFKLSCGLTGKLQAVSGTILDMESYILGVDWTKVEDPISYGFSINCRTPLGIGKPVLSFGSTAGLLINDRISIRSRFTVDCLDLKLSNPSFEFQINRMESDLSGIYVRLRTAFSWYNNISISIGKRISVY